MEREKFGSRLGFILISAGCAIGIGNVWRFPYVAGNNGGGIFVLLYMLFLLMFGIPVLSMELAMGRASKSSIIRAYHELERPGQKWHIHGYLGMIGNYILLFFYTTVSGWMLGYFIELQDRPVGRRSIAFMDAVRRRHEDLNAIEFLFADSVAECEAV